jgi:hypothetical protein
MQLLKLTATGLAVSAALLSGCASYFTPRPPVLEDKVGRWGSETVGTLSTAPDYRVVYVRLKDNAKLCAEPSADVAAQVASTIAGALKGPLGGSEGAAQLSASISTAMKQLFRRSQGVQFFRDGSFALCNLYLNQGISEAAYAQELMALRVAAFELIKLEIPLMDRTPFDSAAVPTAPTPPDPKVLTTAASGERKAGEAAAR